MTDEYHTASEKRENQRTIHVHFRIQKGIWFIGYHRMQNKLHHHRWLHPLLDSHRLPTARKQGKSEGSREFHQDVISDKQLGILDGPSALL